MVDEHLNWKDFINILGSKPLKKISQYESSYIFYYLFVHNYLTYGNMTWCSATVSKLKKLFSNERQAVRTISVTIANVKSKSKEIMGKNWKRNQYKIILQQVLTFTFWIKKTPFHQPSKKSSH